MYSILNKLMGKLMILFVITLTATAISGCKQDSELVLSGALESTQIDINTEVSGKVTSIEKEEGSSLKQGDIVAVLDPSVQKLIVRQQEALVKLKKARLDELKKGSRAEQIQQAEASVKAAKAKLEELKAGSRPEQIKQVKADAESAVTAVKTAEINYSYWAEKYDSVKALFDAGKASESDLKDAKFKLDTANQQLITAKEQQKSAQARLDLLVNGASAQSIKAAEANYEQAQAQLELLKAGSTDQSIQMAEADVEQAEAVLEQSRLILEKYQIKAPVSGTLLFMNVNPGDVLNPGAAVGTLSDLSDLWVKVYIPQKNLGIIKLGQEINLTTSSLKDTFIKGKVTYISDEAEFTPKNTETSESKENTVFKIKIKIMDHVDALRPGMTIDAHFPSEKEQ